MRRGNGAQGRNRTTDTVIFSHVLYQLSYLGVPAKSAMPEQNPEASASGGVIEAHWADGKPTATGLRQAFLLARGRGTHPVTPAGRRPCGRR